MGSSSHAGRTLRPERSKLFKSHWSNQRLTSNTELEAATAADHKVAQSKQHSRDARGVAQHARRAWYKAERCLDEVVQTEGVVRRVARALAVLRPDGKLNDRAWAQEPLREATKLLGGPEWGNVRRFLSDERTLYDLDWLHEPLA